MSAGEGSMCRMAVGGNGLVLLTLGLAVTACEKRATYTVLDLDCGMQKLRFEEQLVSGYNGTGWGKSLLLARGSRWIRLAEYRGLPPDAYGKVGAESFFRLLPPALGYRSFPFDDKRPRGRIQGQDGPVERPAWSVFVDPEAVSRAEYDVVSSCLANNLGAIDRAIMEGRPHEDPKLSGRAVAEASRYRYPQLSSIAYSAWQEQFMGCGPKTLGPRWNCEDGRGYIQTAIGNGSENLVLCVNEPEPTGGTAKVTSYGMKVGHVSIDQSAVVLKEPDVRSYQYEKLLNGRNAETYYASCKDSSGRGFFETFANASLKTSASRAVPPRPK